MMKVHCWLVVLPLMLCLLRVGATPHYSPPSTQSIDEAMRRSSLTVTRRTGISSRLQGREMVQDGGDLVLTRQQYNRLYKGIKGRSEGRTMATPWTDSVIPYYIGPNNFTADQERWIERAMRHWEEVTCVRFRPATPQDENYITIRTGQGCWANLGMLGGPQIVNLDPFCFWIGIIEHELGHAIGLIHEHQRPQRDAYIRVNYYAVQSNFVSALEKYARGSDDKMGLAYDYTSVMHYGKTAFSSNRYSQTLFTRDPTQEDVIGMILGPSFLDAKLVNLMYKCQNYCDRPNKPRCRDDCFLNAQCQCVCKEDLPKERCEDRDAKCEEMKRQGECHGNTFFMHTNCRKACGICKLNGEIPHFPCLDGDPNCKEFAGRGDCEKNPNYMMRKCRLTCGVCTPGDDHRPTGPCQDKNSTCHQLAEGGACVRDPSHMLRDCTKSCDFCPKDVGKDPSKDQGQCSNFDGVCYYWAENNLCQKHFAWMSVNCRKACGLCNPPVQLPPDCVDTHTSCHEWAFNGECNTNPKYMHKACKRSCNICPGVSYPNPTCVDYNIKDCPFWAENYECYGNPVWMADTCPKSCHLCPGDPPTGPAPCKDFKKDCEWWKGNGECQKNPVYMNNYCRVSCGQCTPGHAPTQAPTRPPQGSCVDLEGDCPGWAARGDCSSSTYVMERCPLSCRVCPGQGHGGCVDESPTCEDWASYGQCEQNPDYMEQHCKKSCNKCGAQQAPGCRDEEDLCHQWAASNQCTINPGYMLAKCRRSCGVCH